MLNHRLPKFVMQRVSRSVSIFAGKPHSIKRVFSANLIVIHRYWQTRSSGCFHFQCSENRFSVQTWSRERQNSVCTHVRRRVVTCLAYFGTMSRDKRQKARKRIQGENGTRATASSRIVIYACDTRKLTGGPTLVRHGERSKLNRFLLILRSFAIIVHEWNFSTTGRIQVRSLHLRSKKIHRFRVWYIFSGWN